jgi:energy-coupling factor transport system ATP-binding protein
MEPRALVLDEPTANLDAPARAGVLKVLCELPGRLGSPVVVAEHRLDVLAGAASEIVALDGGAVTWRGGPRDLEGQAEGLSMAGVRVPGRRDLLGLDRTKTVPGGVVLRVSGLVAGYGEREVLRGTDMEVRAGELVALVGPNGGGKTTLLRCVLGLVRPWDGRVELAGQDVASRPTSELARHAGLVFQSPDHQLFAPTVREELEFGPRNLGLLDIATRGRIDALAREYRIDGLLDVHPFRLSHGQKRRVNVASVQSSGPTIIMLDEPFIGQDIRNVRAINERLQAAKAEGAGVLVVSHDLEALSAMADRAVELVNGKMAEVDDVTGLEDIAKGWGVEE